MSIQWHLEILRWGAPNVQLHSIERSNYVNAEVSFLAP